MPLGSSIFRAVTARRLRQIDQFVAHPVDVQRRTLQQLLAKAANTRYGSSYGFGQIKSPDEYRKRVPVVDYEDIKDDVAQMCKAVDNILWPTPVRLFACSSGTTQSRSKFLPVSSEGLQHCHYRGLRDNLIIYTHNNPQTTFYRGKSLTLGGSQNVDIVLPPEIFCGDLSAIMLREQPRWAETFRTPSLPVALMHGWDEKVEAIAKEVEKQNVTTLSGVPSWNMMLIKHILQRTGKRNLLELWPNLELFMHGGVHFGPYQELFRELIPSDNMHYQESYNASEGFFAIQDNPNATDMLLMLDYGVYFEFIPMAQFNHSNPQQSPTLTLDEVKAGEQYAMVISTNSGLWRYLIGDTVVFTSVNPYRIKITGRTRQFINVFGEEVILENVEQAVQRACWHDGARVKDYTVAPIFMGTEHSGAHQWLVEFVREPSDLKLFAATLDSYLCQFNSDYAAKRANNITMGPIDLRVMASGTFMEWMRQRNQLGGQHKVPRLSNTRQWAEQLLAIDAQLRGR